jgi:hypothetical protein
MSLSLTVPAPSAAVSPSLPRLARVTTPPPRLPPHDRVYVHVVQTDEAHVCAQPAHPRPNVNLTRRWHLNSQRVSVPPIPQYVTPSEP